MTAYYLNFLVFILVVRHGVMMNSSDPWDAPVLILGLGSLFLSFGAAAFCNYFYSKHFTTTMLAILAPMMTLSVLVIGKFDEHWDVIPFGSNYVGGQIVIAAFLVSLVVLITAAVALAASTRFGQMMTLVICTAVLALGVTADYSFGQHSETSMAAAIAYRAVPNIGPFWIIDGLIAGTEETVVSFQYVGYVSLYAILLVIGVLSLAVAMFQKREVG